MVEYIPGIKMTFAGLNKPQDKANVMMFFNQLQFAIFIECLSISKILQECCTLKQKK
jgi:hypothetical protein